MDAIQVSTESSSQENQNPQFEGATVASSSSKKRKVTVLQNVHPQLVTVHASLMVSKFIKRQLIGVYPSSNAFPDIALQFEKVGWGCLVNFSYNFAYKEQMVEFYSHMELSRLPNGELIGFKTYVRGREVFVNDEFLCRALDIHPKWLKYPRRNGFLEPTELNEKNSIEFRNNLAILTEQIIPSNRMTIPVDVHVHHLLPKYQFLAKIFKRNLFPFCLSHKTVGPFEMMLMKEFMEDKVAVNLPYLILTGMEQCFLKGCLGFSLLLTKVFIYIECPLEMEKARVVEMNTMHKQLVRPPKSLFAMNPEENKVFLEQSITDKLKAIHETQLVTLQNQQHIIEMIKSTQAKLDSHQTTLVSITQFLSTLGPLPTGFDPLTQSLMAFDYGNGIANWNAFGVGTGSTDHGNAAAFCVGLGSGVTGFGSGNENFVSLNSAGNALMTDAMSTVFSTGAMTGTALGGEHATVGGSGNTEEHQDDQDATLWDIAMLESQLMADQAVEDSQILQSQSAPAAATNGFIFEFENPADFDLSQYMVLDGA